jgi:hypothetical protein
VRGVWRAVCCWYGRVDYMHSHFCIHPFLFVFMHSVAFQGGHERASVGPVRLFLTQASHDEVEDTRIGFPFLLGIHIHGLD